MSCRYKGRPDCVDSLNTIELYLSKATVIQCRCQHKCSGLAPVILRRSNMGVSPSRMRPPLKSASDDVRMRGFAHRQTVDAVLAWLDSQLHPLGAEDRSAPFRLVRVILYISISMPPYGNPEFAASV